MLRSRYMRTAIQLMLFAFFLHVAVAQTQPNAADILKKVEETYRDVSQYELESTITLRDPTTGKDVSGLMRVSFKAPDKYRTEMKGAAFALGRDASEPVIDELVSVYDGSNLWAYNPKANDYRVFIVPDLPRDARPEDADLYEGIGMYRHAVEALGKAQFLREDRMAVGSGTADCFVIESAGPGGAILWIDKNTYHVLRMDGKGESRDSGSSMVFKVVKLNEPISDDLFKFVPPPGARQLRQP
jgi:outer membrane lipoprotein-sorting protein